MLFTLADARARLGKYVDSGSCNSDTIDMRIGEALERLMDMEDWECTRRLVRVQVCGHHFTMPQNVEKILWADIDGKAVRVFGQPYQFLSSGVGDLDYKGCGILQSILDKGDHWATQFDLPVLYKMDGRDEDAVTTLVPDNTAILDNRTSALSVYPKGSDDYETIVRAGTTVYTVKGLNLLARSESAADDGLELEVYGYNHKGETIRETLTIKQWYGGVEGELSEAVTHADNALSTLQFKEVTRVVKPKSTSYITLMGVDSETNYFTHLSKMDRRAGVPTFRRYSIINYTSGYYNSVLALVKLRAVTPGDDLGVLPIDSEQALKLMIMAIREENAGNLQASVAYESRARQVMAERQKASTMTRGTTIVIDVDHDMSLGRFHNHGVVL